MADEQIERARTVKLPNYLWDRIKAAAYQDRRTVQAQIAVMVEGALDQRDQEILKQNNG